MVVLPTSERMGYKETNDYLIKNTKKAEDRTEPWRSGKGEEEGDH